MCLIIRRILFGLICLVALLQTGNVFAQSREIRGVSSNPQNQSFSSATDLKFIPNRGQLSDQFGRPMPEVLYTLDGCGVKTYFTKGMVYYVFSKDSRSKDSLAKSLRSDPRAMFDMAKSDTLSLYRVDVKFIGANPNAEIIASDTTEDYTNYYLANCPDGITHVPGFRKIVYRNIYPKIDLVFYTEHPDQNNYLEYDFVVHPGGDPGAIQIRYDHASSLSLGEDGSFKLQSPYGQVIETKPNGYQIGTESNESVQCGFRLNGNSLSFETGNYDRMRDLYIDPQRLWGTYFGGMTSSNTTQLNDIAVDRGGSVDAVGYTYSSVNIATSGAYQTTYVGNLYDGFIARFGSNGNIRWATYYGGSGIDDLNAITCDTGSGLLIAGATSSTSAIASSGAFQTVFTGAIAGLLASFDSNGARRWATYYSGNGISVATPLVLPSNTDGLGVSVDSASNIILTGQTGSTAGIATTGAYKTTLTGYDDVFIAKFTLQGSRLWCTYFGGNVDMGGGFVGVDANSNIYMAAGTTCTTGIATAGAYQTTPGPACLAKFSPSGGIDWATYYMDSIPYGVRPPILHIAVSRPGNIYFAGIELEPGLASPGAYQTSVAGDSDAILGKFNTNGQRVWATYYGGRAYDILYSITLDTAENLFASGYTESSTGIATPGGDSLLGPYNPFMIKFDSSGHRSWGTYYGRRGYGVGIGLDRQGHPFMGGYTETGTGEYASPGAYQTTPSGYWNGFIAKFCDPPELIITSNATSPVCPNAPVTLSVKSGLLAYQWYVNDAEIPGANSTTYSFQTPSTGGTYDYTVDVTGQDMCDAISDTVILHVRQPSQITFPAANDICPGSSIKLLATATGAGPLRYSWTPAATLDHPDSLQPTATPAKTTIYTLAVTDTNGCTTTKQLTVAINQAPKVSAGGNKSVCVGSSITLTATATGARAPYIYSWTPDSGLDRADSSTVTATPKSSTYYVVEVTDQNGCTSKDSSLVTVNSPPKVSAGAPLSVCIGSSIRIGASITGGKLPYTILWSPSAGLSSPASPTPTASPAATTLYTLTVTDKNGCVGTDSVLVTVSDSLIPTVTSSDPLTICTGDTVHLTAGTGYSTYAWSDGESTSDISVTKSGSYSVHVTNGSGCSGTSGAVQIDVLPDSVPRPTLTAKTTTLCAGDSVEVKTTGSYASYLWSTGAATPSIFVSKTDIVTVTVTNSAGCMGTSAPMIIAVVPQPSDTITSSGPTAFCTGDSITLRSAGGFIHYGWSTGDTTQSIIVKQAGSYFVTATNLAGCIATSQVVSVTVNPAPNPVISGPASICPNSSASYSVSNTAGDTYLWTLSPSSAGTISNASQAGISVQWGAASTATLSLTETAPDGCSKTVSLPVSISSDLTPVITAGGPISFCDGDSVTLDAGAGYLTYQWSKDGSQIAGAASESITAYQSGSYSVFVTASGGCSGSSVPLAVTVYPLPPIPEISQNGSQLTTGPASMYQWYYGGSPIPGDTSQTISPDSDGLYTVTITDANGCSNTSDSFLYATALWAAVSVPPGTLAAPGDTVSIPLRLDSASGLMKSGAATYTANIGLDPTMLSPIDPMGVLAGSHWVVSITGATPTAPGVLQTITALALDSGNCSDVTIDTFYFPGASIKVTAGSGTVCLTGECRPVIQSSDSAFTIKRVSPNPNDGSFTIEYHLAADGPVSIGLEDYLGRKVDELKDEWSQAGDEIETYSASGIPSGVYRLVLRSGARAISDVIVIAK